ncbi:hypothetical protein [Pimelobacter simplex]|uniref:hypothetical protein n=1 Tax=Nocardioides simplex TaxID=2045 RepID=UPI001931CF60|nr:hypothetical protein [Pimelobacter simplex]
MDVFLLWHVRHAENSDRSPIEHRDEDGELLLDEPDCFLAEAHELDADNWTEGFVIIPVDED